MKKVLSLTLALLMAFSCFAGFGMEAFAAKNGWAKETETYDDESYTYWYYYENGKKVTGWKQIKGTWYYFDKGSGEMYAGGYYEIGKAAYFFDANGAMKANGWFKSESDWYYAEKSGALVKGWKKLGGKWYYFDTESYYMYTGSYRVGGKIYLFDANGAWVESPKTGWNSTKLSYGYTEWSYYKNGKFLTGWQKIGGKWYYFNTTHGNMLTSVFYDGKKLYYANSDGSLREKAGWVKESEKYDGVTYTWWYYTYKDGTVATGWKKISGKWYYFDPEYATMYTGVIDDGNKLYYANSDGSLREKAGWVKETGSYDGGTWTNWYYSNKDGSLVTGWKTISGKKYYFAPEMYSDGFYEIDGTEYEFDANGVCLGEAAEG